MRWRSTRRPSRWRPSRVRHWAGCSTSTARTWSTRRSPMVLMASVVLMSMVQVPRVARAEEPANWHAVLEGLRFVRSRPVVFGAISLDLFAVLFGGATALLPAYASDVLHVGPTGLGISAHRAGSRRRPHGLAAGDRARHAPRRALDVRRRGRCSASRPSCSDSPSSSAVSHGRRCSCSARATWSASTSVTSSCSSRRRMPFAVA